MRLGWEHRCETTASACVSSLRHPAITLETLEPRCAVVFTLSCGQQVSDTTWATVLWSPTPAPGQELSSPYTELSAAGRRRGTPGRPGVDGGSALGQTELLTGSISEGPQFINVGAK